MDFEAHGRSGPFTQSSPVRVAPPCSGYLIASLKAPIATGDRRFSAVILNDPCTVNFEGQLELSR